MYIHIYIRTQLHIQTYILVHTCKKGKYISNLIPGDIIAAHEASLDVCIEAKPNSMIIILWREPAEIQAIEIQAIVFAQRQATEDSQSEKIRDSSPDINTIR